MHGEKIKKPNTKKFRLLMFSKIKDSSVNLIRETVLLERMYERKLKFE